MISRFPVVTTLQVYLIEINGEIWVFRLIIRRGKIVIT